MKKIIYTLFVAITFCTFSQTTITLDASKDLQTWSYDPTGELDRGTNRQDIVIYEWTKDGTPTTKYGLIDFDFSHIPAGSEILEAKLFLYHDPTSLDEGHSQMSGSNEAIIQRITSDWEESYAWGANPTSTDVHQVDVPASTSSTQDYEIDITNLVQDNIDSSSYGFIIKLASTNYYRSLVFASSENDNSNLHPKLVVSYNPPMSKCVTLSSKDGKDTQVWSYDPTATLDRGTDRQDIVIYEWTKDGAATTKYGLIDFDFSEIPEQSTITEANLSLFHDASSLDDGHSQLSGSNAAIIQRITSEWAEAVSWNDAPSTTENNELTIPASTSSTQDYNIDVLTITQDIVNNKSNSFGFLIKMAETSYYRSLVFASGEHPNEDLHPKLEVCYSYQKGTEVTSLSDFTASTELILYPNPATDYINLRNISKSQEYQIFDQTGRLVLSGISNQNVIDIRPLARGNYILKSGSDNIRFTKE